MSQFRSPGADLIVAERRRQIEVEGWMPEHDDGHDDASLAVIAAALAVHGTDAVVVDAGGRGTPGAVNELGEQQDGDCWGLLAKHGANRVRALAIAGALIAAEIDRLLRRQAAGSREGMTP